MAIAVALIGIAYWQFGREKMIDALSKGTRSDVQAASYRMLLFPRPGAELRDVRVRRGSVELAQMPKVRIESSWLYLLTFQKKLALLELEQSRLTLPDPLPEPTRPATGEKTPIALLRADGSNAGIRGGTFHIAQLRLRDYGTDGPVGVDATVHPPHPKKGIVHLVGTAGPFTEGLSKARVEGSFRLEGSDLGHYNKLAGQLRGEGEFAGPLPAVKVTGTASVTQFAVDNNEYPIDLEAEYQALVNGQTGLVQLQDVAASFLRTRLQVNGEVDSRKVALQFRSESARIEDLLRIFTKAPTPALKAPVQLTANVRVPNEDGPFLRRVQMDARFRIENAVWARSGTQQRVNNLSARARGNAETAEAQTSERVFSDLSGTVRMDKGVANLRDVRFSIPGTVVTGGGTFNVITKDINLRGKARMEANISESLSGWKSAILKPFNALFRRKSQGKRGAVVPVSIVGRYPKPQYNASLTR